MRIRAERSRPTLVAWDTPGADRVDEAASRAADRAFLARDLESALAGLPAVSRAVVWLHDVEGWTHQEIADAMGRSTSFSKSQLARAHSRLRTMLERRSIGTAGVFEDAPDTGTAARPA